jgi:hypothetical protein
LRGGGHEQALCAVARNDHLSVASAFKSGLAAIQAQIGARSLFAVASEAGGFKHGLNVFVVGHALRRGGRRKLGNIHFGDVPFVRLLLGQERQGCEGGGKNNNSFHLCLSFVDSIQDTLGTQVVQPGSILTFTSIFRRIEPL